MIRKVMPAQVKALGDDEVEVRMSTSGLARDGHILVPSGCQLENYRKNPIILWQHDPDHPVGRSEDIQVDGDEIRARVRFAPAGVSHKADEIRGLVKSGIVSGVSVGFDPLDGEPLDPKKPRGGMRFTSWEMLECSFCSVPVDTDAIVTARSQRSADWKCGASRDLPIEDSDSWDGSAAEVSIFEWAGGDDFDPSKARKGFLAYNASKPKERGSYKLPIAHVIDGRLKVPKGAIRAAASRLPQADIPDSVKKTARAVLDHYEEKADMSKDKTNDTDRSLKIKHARSLERSPSTPIFKRGLYEVGQLAYMLQQMGYCHDAAEYESALEGDQSEVPSMLGEALVKFGEALIAMTQEEVAELLEEIDEGEGGDEMETRDLPDTERAYIAEGKTPRARAWRAGIALMRAGKTLSASNEKKLNEGDGHLDRAMKHHRAMAEHHESVSDHLDGASAAHEKATKSHGELGDALQSAKGEPDKASEHVARALKLHRSVAGHHESIAEAHTNAKDRLQDAGDTHQSLGRSLKAAQRCMRAVVEGSTPGGEDSDSKKIQTSAGTDESTGSEGSRSSLSLRRRQAELLALSAVA